MVVSTKVSFKEIYPMEEVPLSMSTKMSTMDSLLKAKNKEKEATSSVKVLNLKGDGKMTTNLKVSYCYSMEISSKEFSNKIWDTKVFITTRTVIFIKVSGKMISSKDLENWLFQSGNNTRDNLTKEPKTDSVDTDGPQGTHTKEISTGTKDKGWVCIAGVKEVSIEANGKAIAWTASED